MNKTTRQRCEHGMPVMECLVCISPTQSAPSEARLRDAAPRLLAALERTLEIAESYTVDPDLSIARDVIAEVKGTS